MSAMQRCLDMTDRPTHGLEHAINLLHSAEYWYEKYEADLSIRENGHARTVKALDIIADEVYNE